MIHNQARITTYIMNTLGHDITVILDETQQVAVSRIVGGRIGVVIDGRFYPASILEAIIR